METTMLTNKKTKEEIRDLCEQWASDPCWDIEETEGFEAHFSELLAYRQKYEQELKNYQDMQRGRRNLDPHALYDRILILERRIILLEKSLNKE